MAGLSRDSLGKARPIMTQNWQSMMLTRFMCIAIVGYAYLIIFDALGVLNILVSDVIRTTPAFQESNTKRPYGYIYIFDSVPFLRKTLFFDQRMT